MKKYSFVRVQVNVRVHPDDKRVILEMAAKLNKAREALSS